MSAIRLDLGTLALLGSLCSGLAAAALGWFMLDTLIRPLERLVARLRGHWHPLTNLQNDRLELPEPLPTPLLYTLGTMNFELLALAASATGVVFSLLIFDPTLGPLLRLSGLLAGVGPLIWKSAVAGRSKRKLLIELRHLLADLAMAIRYEKSPGRALDLVAARGTERFPHAVVYRRLRLLNNAYQRDEHGTETVLRKLASDLRSPELGMLVMRFEAARRGGLSFEQALSSGLAEIIDESEASADEAVETVPERLLLPMIVSLFLPTVLLILFPIGFYVLNNLAAVGMPTGY
ncbi:MAG: hypothetical protein ACHQIO_11830 [Nevskiales bacterium]